MVWATPSIFKPSVYPSDVIICPINALKAFSSLDNELLSKQPCRAISACRLIWSHKGLMPCGGEWGARISGSHGPELPQNQEEQCFQDSENTKCTFTFLLCLQFPLPSTVSGAQLHQPDTWDSIDPDHHNQGMWGHPYYWKQFPREADSAWKALPDHLPKLWLQQWSLSCIKAPFLLHLISGAKGDVWLIHCVTLSKLLKVSEL